MTVADDSGVRRQVVVDAPIDSAFKGFVERFGDFKPPEHNMLGAPIALTCFEPHVGGNIYDRGEDGSGCRWVRVLVLVYEPLRRRVRRADASRARAPKHRRHGEGWEGIGDGVARDEGWPLYLRRYAALMT